MPRAHSILSDFIAKMPIGDEDVVGLHLDSMFAATLMLGSVNNPAPQSFEDSTL